MYNLGVLLDDSDPGQARRWFEKAAEAGLAILRHAEEITSNVALTCRYYGITRQAWAPNRLGPTGRASPCMSPILRPWCPRWAPLPPTPDRVVLAVFSSQPLISSRPSRHPRGVP